jgi:hypothetical protein
MYETVYTFSKNFTGLIAFTFIWPFFGAVTVTGLPLWESRRDIVLFFRSIFGDLSGRRKEKKNSVAGGSIVSSNEKFAENQSTEVSSNAL